MWVISESVRRIWCAWWMHVYCCRGYTHTHTHKHSYCRFFICLGSILFAPWCVYSRKLVVRNPVINICHNTPSIQFSIEFCLWLLTDWVYVCVFIYITTVSAGKLVSIQFVLSAPPTHISSFFHPVSAFILHFFAFFFIFLVLDNFSVSLKTLDCLIRIEACTTKISLQI